MHSAYATITSYAFEKLGNFKDMKRMIDSRKKSTKGLAFYISKECMWKSNIISCYK